MHELNLTDTIHCVGVLTEVKYGILDSEEVHEVSALKILFQHYNAFLYTFPTDHFSSGYGV